MTWASIALPATSALALLFFSGCSAVGDQLSKRRQDEISDAMFAGPPAATKENVTVVLRDVLQRTYRFTPDTRTSAIRLATEMNSAVLVELVDQIAVLALDEEDEGRRTLDSIAVARALDAITIVRHERAVERNRAWLTRTEPFVFPSAVANLERLKDWESAPTIEQRLSELSVSLENALHIYYAVRFLSAAPSVSKRSCQRLEVIAKSRELFAKGAVMVWDTPELASAVFRRAGCPGEGR